MGCGSSTEAGPPVSTHNGRNPHSPHSPSHQVLYNNTGQDPTPAPAARKATPKPRTPTPPPRTPTPQPEPEQEIVAINDEPEHEVKRVKTHVFNSRDTRKSFCIGLWIIVCNLNLSQCLFVKEESPEHEVDPGQARDPTPPPKDHEEGAEPEDVQVAPIVRPPDADRPHSPKEREPGRYQPRRAESDGEDDDDDLLTEQQAQVRWQSHTGLLKYCLPPKQ